LDAGQLLHRRLLHSATTTNYHHRYHHHWTPYNYYTGDYYTLQLLQTVIIVIVIIGRRTTTTRATTTLCNYYKLPSSLSSSHGGRSSGAHHSHPRSTQSKDQRRSTPRNMHQQQQQSEPSSYASCVQPSPACLSVSCVRPGECVQPSPVPADPSAALADRSPVHCPVSPVTTTPGQQLHWQGRPSTVPSALLLYTGTTTTLAGSPVHCRVTPVTTTLGQLLHWQGRLSTVASALLLLHWDNYYTGRVACPLSRQPCYYYTGTTTTLAGSPVHCPVSPVTTTLGQLLHWERRLSTVASALLLLHWDNYYTGSVACPLSRQSCP